MTTRALTDLLAKKAKVQRSTAAEQVNRMVHDILKSLRQGEPARLPGLGRFEPGPQPKFRFEDNATAAMRGQDLHPPERDMGSQKGGAIDRSGAGSTPTGLPAARYETAAEQCEPVVREIEQRNDHVGEKPNE